jgi:signal transduction histidine kinase
MGETVVAIARRTNGVDGMAEIVIRDTGTGIAPEHLPRIFEPFFTTKPHGTGLGLPFCRDVVERHGGTIEIGQNTPNGTTVVIHLPRLQSDEQIAGG